MTPFIGSVDPSRGPTSGGNLVRIVGDGFSPRVAVLFGGASAGVTLAVAHQSRMVVDVLAPPHEEGVADIQVQNLDGTGAPIDQPAVASGLYTFERPTLVGDSDLTRLVRTVVQSLRRDVVENAHLAVNVDYDDTPQDPTRNTPLARVPSITVSGPTVARSIRYSDSRPIDQVVGGETIRRARSLVVDLGFHLVGASRSVPELLNLLSAAARFVSRTPWISMPRDPENPSSGTVRWDLDAQGDWQTQIPGEGGVHTFTGGFVTRGFALDEGRAVARLVSVESVFVATGAHSAKESST